MRLTSRRINRTNVLFAATVVIMPNDLVLVTGGTGFVGVHVVLRLLQAGYTLRTTVRSLEREAEVRSMLGYGGVEAGERLSFTRADLLRDEGWFEAARGCRFVHHVASPFPATAPKDENELIVPARDGTLRVLRAARDANVQRVVLTSSFAAIGYGHDRKRTAPFTEEDWSDPKSPDTPTYHKSKTLVERAAWDFIAREGRGMELVSVNPVGIFGPTLGRDLGTSIEIIQRLLEGKLPGMPRIRVGLVDVRDIAELHLRGMTSDKAAGQRFLATASDFVPLVEVARILRNNLGAAAKRVKARELPDVLVKLVALFDKNARLAVPELGIDKNGSNAKARTTLDWTPITHEEAIISSGRSLLDLGLVKA